MAPVQNLLILPQYPTVPEDVAVLSGEYCEIESPGIPEEDEEECYSEPLARRSPIGLGSTQGLLCTKGLTIKGVHQTPVKVWSPEAALHMHRDRVDG